MRNLAIFEFPCAMGKATLTYPRYMTPVDAEFFGQFLELAIKQATRIAANNYLTACLCVAAFLTGVPSESEGGE